MTVAPEVTTTDVATFAASAVAASRSRRLAATTRRCGRRTSRMPGSPVIGQRSQDQRRAGSAALPKFGRGGA
jgi:hypothetical protein